MLDVNRPALQHYIHIAFIVSFSNISCTAIHHCTSTKPPHHHCQFWMKDKLGNFCFQATGNVLHLQIPIKSNIWHAAYTLNVNRNTNVWPERGVRLRLRCGQHPGKYGILLVLSLSSNSRHSLLPLDLACTHFCCVHLPPFDPSGEIARHCTFETSGKKMTTSTNLVSVHTNLLCVWLCVSAMTSTPVVPCLLLDREPDFLKFSL